jgi:hypothetical protein
MQRLSRKFMKFDRRYATAFEQVAKIVKRRDQISHRLGRVWLKVAAPNDAFLRQQVNQNYRPIAKGRYACDNRALQLEQHCSRPDRSERQ